MGRKLIQNVNSKYQNTTIMKTETIKYTYDPGNRSIGIYVDGKHKGGFNGNSAERRFKELLEAGSEISITNMDSEALQRRLVKQLRGLWIVQGIDKHRDAILEPYGVQSTSDLNIQQLNELIGRFTHSKHPPVNEQVRQLRHKALALLTRMGIYVTPGSWCAVNDYLMQPRIAGKLLYEMNEEELMVLDRKLHSIATKKPKAQRAVNSILN